MRVSLWHESCGSLAHSYSPGEALLVSFHAEENLKVCA